MTLDTAPLDLCAAAQAVASGTLRAEALLDESLRIARSDVCTHAFTRLDETEARAAARQADQAAAAGQPVGALAGLAVSVKDLFDIASQVTTAGSTVLAGQAPARQDAVVVARLRAAGAALIGRNQMTEFAFSGVGLNPHQGTPANAALARLGLPGRLPGGSTSGGGVSVAAGAAWAALGSDTGGSIRIPAALQGLVGFKNTQALTPNTGSVPLSPSLDTSCAITRSVRDAVRVHEVLADRRVPFDTAAAAQPGRLAGLRFGIAPNVGLDELEPAVATAFQRALHTLSAGGARITEHPLPALADTAPLLVNGGIVGAEAWRWHAGLLLATQEAAYDARVAARIRRGAAIDDASLAQLHTARAAWIERVVHEMDGIDLWLMPTVPLIAPAIAELEASDDTFFRINALMLRNPSLVNLLDGCAISLPCQARGEAPVGLMLWSRGGLDDRLLEAALAIEQALNTAERKAG